MRAEVEEAVQTCPNCQVSQGSKETLQRESARYSSQEGVRPFERWGVDLIGRLLETRLSNTRPLGVGLVQYSTVQYPREGLPTLLQRDRPSWSTKKAVYDAIRAYSRPIQKAATAWTTLRSESSSII